MKNFGLTKERYAQMVKDHNNDKEWVKEIVEEWGIENCNKGYAIFDFNGTGLLEINKIDDVNAFEDDNQATKQAIKDGIKIIPINELPENFDSKYLGWIDTEENRKAIKDYCDKYC